jgi:RecA-family ATPase
MARPLVPLPAAPDPLAAWNLLDVGALSQPLPPIPWLCEAIRLAPGAVTLVAGYGYSRKTMALQSLGLSVATGRSVWGLYKCRKGRVVHLDYEQGKRMTQERYQRLARGLGFELSELDATFLRVAVLPRVYLETQEVVDSLLPIIEGAALVIIDSLRAAFPHAD